METKYYNPKSPDEVYLETQKGYFSQDYIETPKSPDSNIIPVAGGSVVQTGNLQSPNYITQQKGWNIDSDGNAEFQSIIANINTLSQIFTAGEAITKGDAVKIIPPSSTETYFSDPGTTSDVSWDGQSFVGSPYCAIAEKYVASKTKKINAVRMYLRKVNSPADNFYCELRANTADGTLLATSESYAGSTLTTSYVLTTLTFTNIIQVDNGGTYYVVLKRSSPDSVNYYQLQTEGTGGGVGTNFAYQEASGGIWTYQNQPRARLDILLDAGTGGTVKKAKATTTTEAEFFLGFAAGTVASGEALVVKLAGVVTDLTLSSFSDGIRQYYLSDTAGAISTTAGTVTRKVGIAQSTTELLITNIW